MKTLQESLFDTEKNIEKDITFGDIYEPVYITSTNSDHPFQKIANMFNLSKLRKAAKRVDLSGIKQNSPYDNNHIEVIELIAGVIAGLPLKNKISYDYEIAKVFGSLAKQPYWQRGIDVCLSKASLLGSKVVFLKIIRSSMNEYVGITIEYREK